MNPRNPGQTGWWTARHHVRMRRPVVLLALPVLFLTGCSGAAAAQSTPTVAPVDFGKPETAAAIAYYHAHTDALAGAAGADQATVFTVAKDYCKSVALEGRTATNAGYLTGPVTLSQDTVLAYQHLAELYCPVTMQTGS